MLGTPVNKKLYALINKNLTIMHPQDGPIDLEIKDIKGGMVYFETTTGTLSSMAVEDFEKMIEKVIG